jgi:hypothetical protein
LGQIRIVELKVKYSQKVVRQAVRCQLATSDIYVAVTTNPTDETLGVCQKYGIGFLKVSDTVKLILQPHQVVDTWRNASKHLVSNCCEPGDDAGLPCMSGCGPAQAVGECVKQYVEENPQATWKQIFANVPNHYSNYQSMAGAMNGYLGLSLSKLRQEQKALAALERKL